MCDRMSHGLELAGALVFLLSARSPLLQGSCQASLSTSRPIAEWMRAANVNYACSACSLSPAPSCVLRSISASSAPAPLKPATAAMPFVNNDAFGSAFSSA